MAIPCCQSAATGKLDAAGGDGVLEEVCDGTEDIDGVGVVQFALVGLLDFDGLVELLNQRADVGVVFSIGDDEELIESRIGHDLRGGGG